MNILRNIISVPFLWNLIIGSQKKSLRVLMYHGISDNAIPPPSFRAQMELIHAHFECFWVSEIPELLSQTRWKKLPLVLTFDDGLKNQIANALPVLNEFGLKATFYVVPGLMDSNQWIWTHEVKCRLFMLDNSILPWSVGPLATGRKARWSEVGLFVEKMKTWKNEERVLFIEELRDIKNSPAFEHWMHQEYDLMDREDLRNLPKNIEVGAHSLTHPMLDCLSEEEAIREISGSFDILKDMTGARPLSFCYPSGQFLERDVRIVDQVCGLGVSVDEGFVRPGDSHSTLKRIPASPKMNDFRVRLLKPTA